MVISELFLSAPSIQGSMQHGADDQADDRHRSDASQPKPDEVTGTRKKLAHLDLLSKTRSLNPPVPRFLLLIPNDVRSH